MMISWVLVAAVLLVIGIALLIASRRVRQDYIWSDLLYDTGFVALTLAGIAIGTDMIASGGYGILGPVALLAMVGLCLWFARKLLRDIRALYRRRKRGGTTKQFFG